MMSVTPGMIVQSASRGYGLVIPRGPGTPPGYVRVNFAKWGVFSVREEHLQILGEMKEFK